MRLKFYIEYDGTNFSGWQKQKNAKSIQGSIIEAIEEVFARNSNGDTFADFQGSGRTDAGVHAYEQVAHLECTTSLDPETLKQKINEILPPAINILKIEKADERFHARHHARSRQYVYRISKRRKVFERKFAWFVKESLDVEKMRKAANLLVGFHDFKAFSEKPGKEKSTMVVVEKIKISESDDLIFIRIKASHFLWKMVRRITGVLVEAGRGRLKDNDLFTILEQKPEIASINTAPAAGLFLEKVFY
jgi:tRNA pseudouridine38-40 synthase